MLLCLGAVANIEQQEELVVFCVIYNFDCWVTSCVCLFSRSKFETLPRSLCFLALSSKHVGVLSVLWKHFDARGMQLFHQYLSRELIRPFCRLQGLHSGRSMASCLHDCMFWTGLHLDTLSSCFVSCFMCVA